MAALSLVVRLDAAIVDGELLEVGEDAERELGGPGVAAELEGGADVVLDVDGGLLGFEEELAGAADAEAVVGRLGGLADFDGVFVDDVLVGLGVALLVVNVPAEGLEERVEEFAADLGFVVVGRAGRRRGCGRTAGRGRGLVVVVAPSGRAVSCGKRGNSRFLREAG